MQTERRTLTTALALGAWAQTPPEVALVMKPLANEFFLTMEEGAKAHQKANAKQYTLLASGIKDETDVVLVTKDSK